ncbi:hypothetical protein [Crossiella sp. NPDC003009]
MGRRSPVLGWLYSVPLWALAIGGVVHWRRTRDEPLYAEDEET